MAALLLSAAGMLDGHERGGQAAREEPAWFWCDVCRVWVRHDWVTHPDEDQHEKCARDIQRYGWCVPRGSFPLDRKVAAVVKAGDDDGLEAYYIDSDKEQHGVTQTGADMCAVLHRALQHELVHSCGSKGLADRVVRVNAAESLPTIEYGQSIRGHERGGDELAIHARPELALLPACMEPLAHVQHLRILVDPHRSPYFGTPIVYAAIASLGNFLPWLPQRRLTFQWDFWNGRPLPSLAPIAQGTTRFLQTAASSLTSSSMYPLREIVFEIYPCNVPEPRWLQQTRSQFNATLAAAADTRRQALLMGLHQRSAAAGCMLYHLPGALLHIIMTEAIPSVSCTCNVATSPSHLRKPEDVDQIAARIHAYDVHVAQGDAAIAAAAAEAAQRRRGRTRRALIMGAVIGASLLLAAARHSVTEEKERQQEAAAETAAPEAAVPDPATLQPAVARLMRDPTINEVVLVDVQSGAVLSWSGDPVYASPAVSSLAA